MVRLLKGQPPNFDKDPQVLQRQLSSAVELADRYDCLQFKAVKDPIRLEIFELGGNIYTLIKDDPPRWLNLAYLLGSFSVFKEALVHCVGGFPGYEWPTSIQEIHNLLHDFVLDKSARLWVWIEQVTLEVLSNDFKAEAPDTEKGAAAWEQWLVVQIFRDWFLKQRRAKSQPGGLRYTDARTFRLLAEGGDAYLPVAKVKKRIDGMKLKPIRDPAVIEQSLSALKRFAKEVVAPLMKNNLTAIDPVAAGLPYLTCTEVLKADMPVFNGSESVPTLLE